MYLGFIQKINVKIRVVVVEGVCVCVKYNVAVDRGRWSYRITRDK
jgi:hypothetical protein